MAMLQLGQTADPIAASTPHSTGSFVPPRRRRTGRIAGLATQNSATRVLPGPQPNATLVTIAGSCCVGAGVAAGAAEATTNSNKATVIVPDHRFPPSYCFAVQGHRRLSSANVGRAALRWKRPRSAGDLLSSFVSDVAPRVFLGVLRSIGALIYRCPVHLEAHDTLLS
jgi:hypothetical protein